MTPTNDAPVTVEETLRWYAENAAGCRKIGRDGDVFRQALDADGGKRAIAALASAPAGDGVSVSAQLASIKNAARYVPIGDGAYDPYGSAVEAVDAAVDRLAASLVRPRAAVGEQSRSRRLTEEEARELVGFEPETILTCLREWGYVEDTALQSPPAKVEG